MAIRARWMVVADLCGDLYGGGVTLPYAMPYMSVRRQRARSASAAPPRTDVAALWSVKHVRNDNARVVVTSCRSHRRTSQTEMLLQSLLYSSPQNHLISVRDGKSVSAIILRVNCILRSFLPYLVVFSLARSPVLGCFETARKNICS